MKPSFHSLAATVLLVGIGCGENAPDSDNIQAQELAVSSGSKGHGNSHHGKGHHGKSCPSDGGTGDSGTGDSGTSDSGTGDGGTGDGGTACIGNPASGDSDSDGFCNDVDQCPGDDRLMCDSFDCVDDDDCSQIVPPNSDPSFVGLCHREPYRCKGIGKCVLHWAEGSCPSDFTPVCTCTGWMANRCLADVVGVNIAPEDSCSPL
jgi:hypothetical protein